MRNRITPLSLPRMAAVAVAVLTLLPNTACRPDAPAEAPPPPAPTAAPEIPVATTRCTPERASELIEGIALTTADDTCRLFLPLDPEPGSLDVRVSAAGADDLAAIEWTTQGQRVFADRGQVTLSAASAERVTGTFEAEASGGPRVERIEGSFDIALTPP